MTWAAVGSSIQQFNTSSFSLTPGGVGDLILLEIANKANNTVSATALSSSNVTWAQMGTTLTGATNTMTAVIFAGTVTSTSAATVTITWSGTTPSSYQATGQEFSSTVGSWALDVQGGIDSLDTNTWASLTPAAAGELYFGWAFDNTGAAAGSTTGFVYIVDAHANGLAYNLSCGAGATAPVWGDSTMNFGKMIMVKETASAGPPGTVQPRAAVPVPRRRLARAAWRAITGQAYAAVPAPRQEYQLAPRRKLARAVWRGGAGQAYVAVPAPAQQFRTAPRRKPSRAYVQFIPVTTTNAAAAAGVAGTVPALMASQTRVIVRRDGRVVRR